MTAARSLLERFQHVKAFVVGDAMIDHYSFGRIDRLSPEAPVPVFIEERQEDRSGGAANVVHNLQSLGLDVWHNLGPKRSTKRRYFVGHHQVFRIDEDQRCEPAYSEINWAVQTMVEFEADVLVISDYAKGWITEKMAERLIAAASEASIPVVVDPKGTRWGKYRGATVLCPNQAEYDAAVQAGTRCEWNVLIKQGEKGAMLLRPDPVSGLIVKDLLRARARHVYDVTGAGDTVTAVVAAVLGADGDLRTAADWAMVAAGHVVGEVGTCACPLEVLRKLLGRDHGDLSQA